MIWPMKAGSVLLGGNSAEASNQGVWRGAGGAEAMSTISILELMVTNNY
jgi:hypothetical protein